MEPYKKAPGGQTGACNTGRILMDINAPHGYLSGQSISVTNRHHLSNSNARAEL